MLVVRRYCTPYCCNFSLFFFIFHTVGFYVVEPAQHCVQKSSAASENTFVKKTVELLAVSGVNLLENHQPIKATFFYRQQKRMPIATIL